MKAAETRAERGVDAPSKPLTVEPVFPSEPDLRHESGKLVAWFTEPAGAVLQLTEAAVFTKGAKPPPLYMTTLHAAVALLNAIGPEIRVYETLEGALKHMRLTAATAK